MGRPTLLSPDSPFPQTSPIPGLSRVMEVEACKPGVGAQLLGGWVGWGVGGGGQKGLGQESSPGSGQRPDAGGME